MDLRAKNRPIGKALEWILRLRWPIILIFGTLLICLVMLKNGFLGRELLESIHLNLIFPIQSANYGLLQGMINRDTLFLLGPWFFALIGGLIWLGWRWLFAFAFSLLLVVFQIEFSTLPWVWLALGALFCSYLFAPLYTPLALIAAIGLVSVIDLSLWGLFMAVLDLRGPVWHPYLVGGLVFAATPVVTACLNLLAGWLNGDSRREVLVRAYENHLKSILKICGVTLASLVIWSAISQQFVAKWFWATLVSVFVIWLINTVFIPALFSTFPLSKRNIKT